MLDVGAYYRLDIIALL